MLDVREICNNIRYVGVNDRVSERFENLWPLPYGVSYNSYLVEGSDKTALIDTVEVATLPEFMDNLRAAGRRVDYLVVNHMEPDHSGSIPEIVKAFPEVKIIGNRQTIGMIGGYYKITDPNRFIEVKDGDTVSLGDMTLAFYLIPMVHWPETMATYVAERKALFSGDAFGCFGALNGGVTDQEMDTDWYFGEMVRYYSNIVGKYGTFVQRALAKLKNLPIDWLCSTHGPVWHDRRCEVIDLYDRLSQYKAERGVTIVYGSMYGHTATVAEALARELTARGVRKIRVHNASKSPMSEMIADAFRYQAIVVGSPNYSMHIFPPVEQFLCALETREIKNRVFASFSSFTWAQAVPPLMQQWADKMKLNLLGNIAMKQSPNADTLAAVRDMADKIVEALDNVDKQ